MNRQLSMATRGFLFTFIPVGLTLVLSLVAISSAVEARIKQGLRDSLRRDESRRSNQETEYRDRTLRVLSAMTQNSALKAAIGLSRESHDPETTQQVKATVVAQLTQMRDLLEYDLLLLQDVMDHPMAAVATVNAAGGETRTQEIDTRTAEFIAPSLLRIQDKLYESISIPINLADENLGTLVVGRKFAIQSWGEFGYASLFRDGRMFRTSFPPTLVREAEQQWIGCGARDEGCEVWIGGEAYLALPMLPQAYGSAIRLVSFQSIDAATREFTQGMQDVFPVIGGVAVLLTLVFSLVSSRSVARPLSALIAAVRKDTTNGSFALELPTDYRASEVNFLAKELRRAAGAVRDVEHRLDQATEQFLASMAQALDARDANTAGHSQRVSSIAASIARDMGLSPEDVEIVRIGAMLHDIGKIGIPDNVLLKPGKLTREEFELIKLHPQIGRQILENVAELAPYIPIVELHHENMDGSGYPYGLTAEAIPMTVRIVQVVDVYDAITTDRTYRKAMSEEQAWELMWASAGKQFDREIVERLWAIYKSGAERNTDEPVMCGT